MKPTIRKFYTIPRVRRSSTYCLSENHSHDICTPFHKSSRFKLLESRVNRFLIHATLVCDGSARLKTVIGLLIAVPEQTAIDHERFWLQGKLEYLIGNDEENFVFHFYILMTKQKDSHLHTGFYGNTNKRTVLVR